MKRHTVAIALAFGAVLSLLPMQAQTKTHRVLFAMTSPDEADWQLTLNNIRNLKVLRFSIRFDGSANGLHSSDSHPAPPSGLAYGTSF